MGIKPLGGKPCHLAIREVREEVAPLLRLARECEGDLPSLEGKVHKAEDLARMGFRAEDSMRLLLAAIARNTAGEVMLGKASSEHFEKLAVIDRIVMIASRVMRKEVVDMDAANELSVSGFTGLFIEAQGQ